MSFLIGLGKFIWRASGYVCIALGIIFFFHDGLEILTNPKAKSTFNRAYAIFFLGATIGGLYGLFFDDGQLYLEDRYKPKYETTLELDDVPKTTEITGALSRTVYWTPGGGSYHFSPNCTSLKRSSRICDGTLSEAIAEGKTDPCNLCADGS